MTAESPRTVSAHTPGPWEVSRGPNTSEGSYSTPIMPVGGGDQVASAYGWGDVELAMANARLIAAAPRMLQALKAIIGLGVIPSTQPEYRMVMDAIEKANA